MWSFVGCKRNKVWLWLAQEVKSGLIVGFHAGARDRRGANALLRQLPEWMRRKARFFTDDWPAYQGAVPAKRHFINPAISNKIERLNLTIRQRVSRLVRKSLSFSKDKQWHLLAIRFFINHYNASLTS